MNDGSTVLLHNILSYINKEFLPNLFVDWVVVYMKKMHMHMQGPHWSWIDSSIYFHLHHIWLTYTVTDLLITKSLQTMIKQTKRKEKQ